MISFPLLKREIKANYKLLLIFMGVLTMYVSMIVYMFDPKIGETLQAFEESMPGVMAAFGMSNMGTTLTEFLTSYLFGFLLLIFPMIFEIILSNKLIARYVDRGSMAYILASPNSRKKIAFTQGLFLIKSIAILLTYTMIVGIVTSEIAFPGSLDIPKYILLHVGLLCLHIAISGLGFLTSCLFNDTKFSYAISAGVPIGFYLIQMLANMGGHLENLKYITIFTLFDTDKLIAGDANGIFMILILLVSGLILYAAGIWQFNKRDLPL
ncbi:ABC transporter permease subunit [Clostridium cellulovorans]|uniref:ABC-2 type transport system permease protein n=1 Tax=Clostridium cellulovorans (strain ATCC 35296 / DSM 3052 / OCM 3 / 743B) TaxID=573061 RepID=D9SQH9_CLOC7|nr:ABC transporter permease subunit [Clostridium cellulovorans]ADL50246.1 hypothetical protein Clocel_0470 [Clostridium cellulovorans 743B]